MKSSFIINSDYFKIPETGKLVRESGIEDRYKRAFELCDSNFSILKDDWSDGVIRYTENNSVVFYGIQECKKLVGQKSIYARIVQGLCYVYDWMRDHPDLLDKFKVLFLPTEKYIDIIYLQDLLKSSFWTQFCFIYDKYKTEGSASNFYKNNNDIVDLIHLYINRIPQSHYDIKGDLDFNIVINEILCNCYERD